MYLLEAAPNIEVLMFCETHLNDRNNDLFSIEGYSCFIAYRSSQRGGGVTLYIKNNLTAKKIPNLSVFIEGCFESLAVEVGSGNDKFCICEIYRPPSGDIFFTIHWAN